jgi:hypothetical protein
VAPGKAADALIGYIAATSGPWKTIRASDARPRPYRLFRSRPRLVRQRFLPAIGVLVVVALAPAGVAQNGHSPLASVRVEVQGFGSVVATPGSRSCRHRCTWRFRRGTVVRLRARPGAGTSFVGWGRACSGRAGCAIRAAKTHRVLARFAPSTRIGSWSRHVSCTPVLTTLPEILGAQESPASGATESGGKFQPHLAGTADKHLLNPPCAVGGTPTFVEVHDVTVSMSPRRSGDGDQVANLTDPNRPDIANPHMKTLHVEIDGTWVEAGVAPPLLPPVGTHIDVQGFVYWDPDHVDRVGHSYSGWELHPLAAWRPALRR